ncbi:MAG: 50S ribosomal protein L19 [Pseudomonadota bacterium]
MKNQIINKFEKRVFKDVKPLPDFRSGDTVRVHYKIQEGADAAKFRIQTYEGIVTRYRKGTAGSSFTVRKISAGGIGVERIFPSMSPLIEKLEVIAQGRVRRSRLYYLRDLSGKAARIRSRYFGGAVDAAPKG